jgi:2-polyprenyl-3-methyl-5-hydroxy-6-metoxy-1,4-benzoquinol methylase
VSGGDYYLAPDLYDAVYADVVADIAPHVERVRSAGGPALELCCGNGRLLLPVLEAGLRCDGLDADERMLESLRGKLAARGLKATLVRGDMRDFSLHERYALIAIGFNSFLHNLTQADQLATLRCCRHHLAAGGRLVLNAFHPSAEKLIEWTGPEKLAKDLPFGDGRVRMWDRAEDDRVDQVRRMTRRIEITDASGAVTRREEVRFSLRYVYKPEMELLLHVAGFPRWQVRPAFASYMDAGSLAGDRPIQEGDVLEWTAWKD